MKICEYCNAPLEEDSVFCTNCGAKLTQQDSVGTVQSAAEPVQVYSEYTQPMVSQPVYSQPLYYEAQAPKGPSVKQKVFGGVGFGCGIFSFVMSFITIVIGIAAMNLPRYEAEVYGLQGMYYALFFGAFGVAGAVFSLMGKGGLAKTGAIFSFVSLALHVLAFVFSVSAMA